MIFLFRLTNFSDTLYIYTRMYCLDYLQSTTSLAYYIGNIFQFTYLHIIYISTKLAALSYLCFRANTISGYEEEKSNRNRQMLVHQILLAAVHCRWNWRRFIVQRFCVKVPAMMQFFFFCVLKELTLWHSYCVSNSCRLFL